MEEYGARNGFLVDSLTFFCSALFLWSMNMKWRVKINMDNLHRAEVAALETSKTIWQDMKEGFDYLIGHKEIRFVLNMLFILLAAAGASYVVLVVFIQETFGSVTKDLGVLAVALGGGLFLGFMAYGKWGAKVKWYQTIFVCLLLGGLMMMAFAGFVHLYPHLWMAIGLAIVWGIVIGPIFIASNTVVQMMSTDEMRGKMFSALEIVIHLAFLLAMLLSWWLSTFVQTVWILMGVGAVVTLVSLVGLLNKSKLALQRVKKNGMF
ncbi:hypothetical protein MNBD_BACTEROID05-637 [hydrothermal vent metagenome]|uniref:Major facilitator superfamily (MFS) profile domain-containing protein n=1 Tax=hydrothermal vent metagenome TaxID=652676 RepID=A0A3B0TFT2_9ZZZZ